MVHVNLGTLLRRHNPRVTGPNPSSPLQLGNGSLGVAIDRTGLQTFPEDYPGPGGGLLGSYSQWGWRWVRSANSPVARPSRFHLGRIGLVVPAGVTAADLEDGDQEIDLGLGLAVSRFRLHGVKYAVHTTVDTRADALVVRAVQIGGPRLGLTLSVPVGPGSSLELRGHDAEDSWLVERRLGGVVYGVRLTAAGARLVQTGPQRLHLLSGEGLGRPAWTDGVLPRASAWLEAVVEFAPSAPPRPPSVDECLIETAVDWQAYWEAGGRIDLAGSDDPAAGELERRLVLSQYLLRANLWRGGPAHGPRSPAGGGPSGPVGLFGPEAATTLGAYVWPWAALAQWNHLEPVERALDWYAGLLAGGPGGGRGGGGRRSSRWPAVCAPDGRPVPDELHGLVYQQPQPILLAELVRRARPSTETLQRHAEVVFASADGLVALARSGAPPAWSLGPPLLPAHGVRSDRVNEFANPIFELNFWHWALAAAVSWAERLGRSRRAAAWREALAHLPHPEPRLGRYPALLGDPWPAINHGHPAHVAALGLVPRTGLIDDRTMEATLEGVLDHWDFTGGAGWDYPLLAMAATRLHRPDLAVQALLLDRPGNVFAANGHNASAGAPADLAANGAVLLATGLMAAGWDGSEDKPGFGRGWDVVVDRVARLP